jgi:hypothetical protein
MARENAGATETINIDRRPSSGPRPTRHGRSPGVAGGGRDGNISYVTTKDNKGGPDRWKGDAVEDAPGDEAERAAARAEGNEPVRADAEARRRERERRDAAAEAQAPEERGSSEGEPPPDEPIEEAADEHRGGRAPRRRPPRGKL